MTAETPLVRGHRLTPSFTDSAIDVELTEEFVHDHDDVKATTASSNGDVVMLNQRIVHIGHLVANNNALRGLSQDDCAAVNTYLDNIEKLLDPRADISQTVALNCPASSTGNATPTASDSRRKSFSKNAAPQSITTTSQPQLQTVSHDLTSVLKELSSVNSELRQRYLESRHIHDLFIIKCEGLAQRILELEEEVHELKSDILEDTIELEGLRGTVRGLDSWVNRWQRQRDSSSSSSSSPLKVRSKSKSYWRRKPKPADRNEEEEEDGNDLDTLLDGVLAWMRGWNDVEEGFLIRARRRKLRREKKGQLSA
ncbi:hypothetical protein TMatcc_006861 [Talaromyces marneffei ATCC 18224]|uniref:Uncharacterized protein n=1 Tax=Talaromyces marneffei (strain ATCC 18224 / CBS 334.59 / QM 7333) TaxID=441960 RepID=B6QDK3_TALMQ|nr:uncharacterized protein EYB26_003880 [Talaromyces marneffei]EEA23789.1 conserved hypothetical protein [Talaromyces marneffei ATCC 18224]KAE8553687.1 hypothetical protein EYB25_005069 [Talaromyces marneffei]QGA16213.1 hypothetical protein EYB26_003880 [Talaromyces marneffei]